MPAAQHGIFISSVQKELAGERRALKSFIESDPLLSRFFRVFLFEDLPAGDRRADAVYLAEVDRCAVYVGIFGDEYGFEDVDGISPTEREFERAAAAGKPRLIFVKGMDDRERHPKMRTLIGKAGQQLIRRRFSDHRDLTEAVYASLVDYLEANGAVQTRPFEERPCPDAIPADIDARAVADFLRAARLERQFPLAAEVPTADVLAHLHLVRNGFPTNAAILLFGREPQRFLPAAEVRCMHFHGTEVQRPVPFYRIFKGVLFEQVDLAVDFVLSKLNRGVGIRAESSHAPVSYEVPPEVIREAVVNAVAHRDYSSHGAVQVCVFADRVEVWNPGALPAPLTPEALRRPHGSIPRNPRVCEALFLARYIEKFGTGTLMMIRQSIAHSLAEPDFVQRASEFTTTIWRDWLTDAVLAEYGLNERQKKALRHAKAAGRINNAQYRELTGISDSTALRELRQLTALGLFEKHGGTGQSAHYVISKAKPAAGNPS